MVVDLRTLVILSKYYIQSINHSINQFIDECLVFRYMVNCQLFLFIIKYKINLIYYCTHVFKVSQQGQSHKVFSYHFKPGTCGLWQHVPGFLKLLWFAHQYVCVSAPKGINNQWHDMV